MATRQFGRNDPCPCGSGRKYKVCCLSQRPPGVRMEPYSVRQPRAVHGDGASESKPASHIPNGSTIARQNVLPKVRIGVDYWFDEEFGRAEVSYSFPISRTIVLEGGSVTWVEFLKPGSRFQLEDGAVGTVTKVDPPTCVMPPSGKVYEGELKEKRILGTIKRTGYIVFDILVGGGLIVTTTPGHPFYSVTRQTFVPAGTLRPGELLRNDRGGTTPVVSVGRTRHGRVELYNVEVQDFHTFFVGTPKSAILVHNGLEGVCSVVKPLGTEEAGQLSEGVLFRTVKGDHRGRPFGTPRNPGAPTVEDFNPRVGEIPAGELGGKINGRKHGIFPEQAERVKQLSNEDLLRFRLDDPMSGHANDAGFSITGGHHRMNEIVRRVQAGELPANTPVRILFHD